LWGRAWGRERRGVDMSRILLLGGERREGDKKPTRPDANSSLC